MMQNDSESTPCGLSSAEFLTALGKSLILTEAQMRAVRAQFAHEIDTVESSAIAEALVREGLLSGFQARRLLVGHSQGLVCGRYTIIDKIGEGAMGQVYQARHQLMDRLVALKMISPNQKGIAKVVSRFFREMKIVGRLNHPNVVRAFDADQYDNTPFIVMEFLEGEDFGRLLRRRGTLPADEAVGYMAQASWGLAHAHEQGIIHRDIKPTNLFLDTTGVVKVLDLGLGAFVEVFDDPSKARDPAEQGLAGTADYMAPEQLTGQPIDFRMDLFSLGCTLYYALAGVPAFTGPTKIDRLFKRISERHVPITDVRPNLPYGLVSILDRMLATNPDDRFHSAAELAEALEALITSPGRTSRGAPGKDRGRSVRATTVPLHSDREPDPPPLNWALIEPVIPSSGHAPGAASTRGERTLSPLTPKPVPLDSHRKKLEADGTESGRNVQSQYRQELIKLKRNLTDKQTLETATDPPASWRERFLDRCREQVEEFLTEPSLGQILGLILAVIAILAVVLGIPLFL
jgi:serine/threonine protein kinase